MPDQILISDLRALAVVGVLPHQRFAERRFVLAPLADIAPERCPAGRDEDLEPAGVYPRGRLVDL